MKVRHMERDKQKELVGSLISIIIAEIDADFEAGKIPESWNGVELRWLIAKKFAGVVLNGIGTPYRKRGFNNHCLVENL